MNLYKKIVVILSQSLKEYNKKNILNTKIKLVTE